MTHGVQFRHERSFALQHPGAPSLIGATQDGQVLVEEIYGDEGWLAQGHYDRDGTLLRSVDEDHGRCHLIEQLPLPADLTPPARGWHTMRLNFAGPRHRGNRELERVDSMVQPLSIAEKIAIGQYISGSLTPMKLIGLAESYVLAECQIVPPSLFVVCRRLRYAYAIDPQSVTDGEATIDYDTRIVHIMQLIDLKDDAEGPISDHLGQFAGVDLKRPMDCLLVGNRLFVADGGDPALGRLAHIHIWRVDGIPPTRDATERIHKRLYE